MDFEEFRLFEVSDSLHRKWSISCTLLLDITR